MDEAEAEGCPQEESLRTVLRNLGIQESDLQGDLRNFPGVAWSLWQRNKNQQKTWSKIFWEQKKCQICAQICVSVPMSFQFVLQDEALRKVVKKMCLSKVFLGMPTLRSVRHRCVVYEIYFPGRRDLRGSLHPQIAELAELQALVLDDTNVSGSLEVLANNTQLERLYLRHTRVTGRLADLSKTKEFLQFLDLTGTEVTGDLATLANFTWLNHLRLSNTAVSGELKSLAKLERLTELDLSNTAVSGELKSLEKLTELKQLDLANLKVVGDAAVMAEWSKIEHIDISGTEVEFFNTDFLQQFEPWNGKFVGVVDVEWFCPLHSALRFLDVSRTPQFSLAQNLLRPFAGCGKLATLKAAGCGLSGPLWPEILYSRGYSIPIDEWPLSQALSVLDFARNNVTDVAELPGSCRTFVLTGNPGVSFGAGVVEKAIKEMVFIDLRNATFAKPSDALLKIGRLAAVRHVLRSIVVPAVTSYAESISRTYSSQNFQISSERMVCKFVEKCRLMKVGQVRFDTKRCATRF